jgi:hypothetical protein
MEGLLEAADLLRRDLAVVLALEDRLDLVGDGERRDGAVALDEDEPMRSGACGSR